MDSRTGDSGGEVLRLGLLGTASAWAGGGEVAGLSRKDMALLAVLGMRAGQVATREALCGLLWPDSASEQARASLRQALSRLRRALGPAGAALTSDRDRLGLDDGRLETDVAAFLAGAEAEEKAAMQAAAALYRGDLMDGFGPVSPEFDRWLEAERGALRSTRLGLLLRLCDAHEADGEAEQMIAVAQRMLAADPLQEHVHRRLMRGFLRQSRHDAALKQFEALREVLASQLGVAPEPPTVELMKEIRAARGRGGEAVPATAPARPAAAALVAPARPSIAVLRFRALADDPQAALLGEGLSEDVTIELARQPDLLVVSRQSSFRVEQGAMSPAEIGTALGVRFLLSGTVRTSGDRLRVTAHLVNCETGHEVWAERYDRMLEDFFDIQTEIARTVTATTADRIAAEVLETSGARRLEDLEGYQLVIRGIAALNRFSEEGYREAIGLFEGAVARDRDNARAHGWLALSRVYLRWNIDASVELADVIAVAQRAIALDAREPKGNCALAMCNFVSRRFDRAEFHFQAAMRSNPNDELVLTEYGRYLMYLDRTEEGLRHIREAMRVNPFHPVWFYAIQGRCLHTLGRYDEAAEAFARVQDPPFYVHAYLAACYAKLGDEAGMKAARAALYRMRPDFDLLAFKAIFPYKNPKTADRLFESFHLAGLK